MNRRQFAASSLALLTPDCAGDPEFIKPTMQIADQYDGKRPTQTITVADAKWWSAFQDPVFDRIVDARLSQNLDIRRAVARIKQADGLSAAAGYPISGAVRVGEGKINGQSGSSGRTATGFARAEASWRLDVFGELENERKAGSANLGAAYEDADIWRLILISDVISTYIDLRFSQELIRVTKRVNQSRRKTLKETKKLSKAGQANEIAVAQAEALLATSRASKPELEVSFIRSLNRIIALVGVTELISRREFDVTAPQPLPRTTIVQTGVPSDLIRNRPDIRRLEKRLQSALAGVGATRKVQELARRQFINGESSFLQVQDAERSFLAAENSLTLDRRNLAVDNVSLNIALCGTYSPNGGLM
ncbi:TolC family protein [Parasedimentitalea maritima]|uniref:Outer membrane efflux protein n=1 Tax=Parasedimentitalea maritima TaxID=2578117 RepID=A0A6A4RA22_9RHOB|nr:TolC family protein [Zongyanglinia marina]KAE9625561.1 hypothetical protein GP644_22330 [Zongyanglinia marina]